MTNPITAQIHSGRVILAPTDASPASGRREYDCVFMQPGLVRRADGSPSNWLIPAQSIAVAASKFNAITCHIDHPALFGFGWRGEPSVKDIAGVTFSPEWSEDEQVLRGGIRLYDTGPGTPAAFIQVLMDQMLADRAQGLTVPGAGLSATLYHLCDEEDDENGQRVTHEIVHVESMDFVYFPGAGGYVRAALSAAGYEPGSGTRVWSLPPADTSKTVLGGTIPMLEKLQTNTQPTNNDTFTPNNNSHAPLTTSPPPAPQPPPVPSPQSPVPDPSTSSGQAPGPLAALTAQVEALTATLAASEAERTVEGMGQPPLLVAGFTGREEFEVALDCLLAGVRPPEGVRPLSGIREAYLLLSGDYEMTGLFHPDRVSLAAVTTTTMAGLVANALNKRVINTFQEYDQWWLPAVTIEDFATLNDARWITLGGVGELPTVAEGAAYTEMTWDDQTETDAFTKKGGYLGITLETIDKDDTRKVQAAPRALAQAAWLTLGKAISAIFTDASGTGPTMSDSYVLFDATNHSNLLTAALSWAEYNTVKTAMMKQTELNSAERLGALTCPYYLWVPIDLETRALQIMASEGEPGTADNDINPFAEGEGREARLAVARRRVIVCPFWTDTNNWAAQANPQLYPSIGLGFRYGRTPEIFSVASPTAGLMFSNDTMPIKVRFFYAVGPTDWRGLHKSNVA